MPGPQAQLFGGGRRGDSGLSGNREAGARGEGLALAYLIGLGYELVERNYRTRRGEADLILRHGTTLVFVEVKLRRGTGFGDPLEAVTPRKREKVRAVAEEYLAGYEGDWPEGIEEVRFDAIGVTLGRGDPQLLHVEEAF